MSTGFGRPQRDDWAQRKDNNVERLTDAEVQLVMETHVASEWCWENGSPHCADLLCEEEWPCPTYRLAAELATLRSQHAEVLGTVREMIKAIALAEQVELRELGYVVTRGVTDESPQSWWDSQSWPIYHAIVALVTLAQEGQ